MRLSAGRSLGRRVVWIVVVLAVAAIVTFIADRRRDARHAQARDLIAAWVEWDGATVPPRVLGGEAIDPAVSLLLGEERRRDDWNAAPRIETADARDRSGNEVVEAIAVASNGRRVVLRVFEASDGSPRIVSWRAERPETGAPGTDRVESGTGHDGETDSDEVGGT